jgi:hypothetical protein
MSVQVVLHRSRLLFACLSFCLSIYDSLATAWAEVLVHLSVCLSVCLVSISVCLSLSVCLSVYRPTYPLHCCPPEGSSLFMHVHVCIVISKSGFPQHARVTVCLSVRMRVSVCVRVCACVRVCVRVCLAATECQQGVPTILMSTPNQFFWPG